MRRHGALSDMFRFIGQGLFKHRNFFLGLAFFPDSRYRPKRRFAPHSKTLREAVARWGPVKRVVRKILVPTTDASASVMSSTTNRSQAKPTRVTFWNVMYPKVKQELRRKYPRHEWR